MGSFPRVTPISEDSWDCDLEQIYSPVMDYGTPCYTQVHKAASCPDSYYIFSHYHTHNWEIFAEIALLKLLYVPTDFEVPSSMAKYLE